MYYLLTTWIEKSIPTKLINLLKKNNVLSLKRDCLEICFTFGIILLILIDHHIVSYMFYKEKKIKRKKFLNY
jgi:hypothetical protein